MADLGFAQVLDNFRKDQAKERAKEQKELEKKMADETKELESINKELKDANKDRKAELQRDKAEIDATRAERSEEKDHRNAVKRALDEEKGALEKFKEELEAQGKHATDSKEYNKKSLELQKKELALRLKSADSPSARKEIKQEQRALEKKNTKLLGTIAKGMVNIGDWTKMKLKGAGKTLWTIIKGTFFAAFLIGLIAFLNSKYWETAKIKLAEFFVSLQDGLQMEDIAELFGIETDKLKERFKSIIAIVAAIGLGLALSSLIVGWPVLIGTVAAAALVYFGWKPISLGFKKLKEVFKSILPIQEEWQADLAATVTMMAGFFGIFAVARKLLRKIPGLGKGAAAAAAAGAAIHGGGAAADVAARKFDPKAMFKKNQVIELAGGKKVIWRGDSFAQYTGRATHGQVHTTTEFGKLGRWKGGGLGGNITKEAVQAGMKNPAALGRFMKVANVIGKVVKRIPILSSAFASIMAYNILSKKGLTKAAVPELSGLFGGSIAALAGAAMGGFLGLPGMFIGGLMGYVGGEAIGRAVAQWIVGEKITALGLPLFGNYFNDLVNDLISGKSGRGTSMPMGGFFEGASLIGKERVEAGNVAALNIVGTAGGQEANMRRLGLGGRQDFGGDFRSAGWTATSADITSMQRMIHKGAFRGYTTAPLGKPTQYSPPFITPMVDESKLQGIFSSIPHVRDVKIGRLKILVARLEIQDATIFNKNGKTITTPFPPEPPRLADWQEEIAAYWQLSGYIKDRAFERQMVKRTNSGGQAPIVSAQTVNTDNRQNFYGGTGIALVPTDPNLVHTIKSN